MADDERCGAEHPEMPGVHCERTTCVEFHRSGPHTWTRGAAPMPPKKSDPAQMAAISRRVRAKTRSQTPRTP